MSPWKCSAGTQGLHVGPHAHGGSLPLLGMCCDASWSSCPLSSLTCPSIFRRARWSGPPPDPSLSGQVKGGEGGTGAVPHQASADAQISNGKLLVQAAEGLGTLVITWLVSTAPGPAELRHTAPPR